VQAPRDLLTSIPGVSWKVADIIIAETGADMTAFPTAAHLCSWAGVSPGQHESAGRRRTAPTRAGNRHLKAALCTAAMSTTRQRNTYLCAKYRRIAARRGKLRAVVAIERAILTAVWHMLSTGTCYQDPGPDYYSRHDPSKRAARAVRDLQALGYQVTVHPSPWPTKPTNSPVSYHQRGGQPDDDADYQTACQSARTVAVNGGRG
jgi:transposase